LRKDLALGRERGNASEKGFPFVRLTARDRVYLAEDVLEWLEKRTMS